MNLSQKIFFKENLSQFFFPPLGNIIFFAHYFRNSEKTIHPKAKQSFYLTNLLFFLPSKSKQFLSNVTFPNSQDTHHFVAEEELEIPAISVDDRPFTELIKYKYKFANVYIKQKVFNGYISWNSKI